MKRYVGTVTRGIRTPIVKMGDNLVDIVYDSVTKAVESEDIQMQEKDVVCVTESLLARSQGNYATTDQIAKDVAAKFPNEIGVIFPILSRNRFSTILRGIAKSGRKLHILLAYPSDEVGNHLMDEKLLYGKKINPYTDILEENQYREAFGQEVRHTFTGIDYVTLYKEIAPNCEIHFSNDPKTILNYTKDILVCSIHTRELVKQQLKDNGAEIVFGLDDILTESIDGSGFNPEYGLLGSNMAGEEKVKLFPRHGQEFVTELQKKLNDYSKTNIEVMVYGDGAFKDPVGKIWELADPVVSPAYTSGLEGTPNELKMKYIADTELENMSKEEMEEAILSRINKKDQDLTGRDETLGTTPRRLTDLLGSLADLTSGSGDKGTPVVYVQGYFDNYASN
ncbi:coenzyme F420-0:L-glutamate ligase [Peptoniphilus sp. KCTC 25270]|uniref:coenzyme F420-0:L-glutamate ligase n=1 Tax=Peptoniphilus sp. KCTC 25270 TaxID=2897414 RepID=UPI001E60C7C7|nr:coenzyme F420-0:L-glutamate ligase [Peptoniphilus sp. KCTC 25270]MCD1147490.1 coenzyme F420-0:L-glutamate ligase [Peptoniphilus sp. KCTC 25270]